MRNESHVRLRTNQREQRGVTFQKFHKTSNIDENSTNMLVIFSLWSKLSSSLRGVKIARTTFNVGRKTFNVEARHVHIFNDDSSSLKICCCVKLLMIVYSRLKGFNKSSPWSNFYLHHRPYMKWTGRSIVFRGLSLRRGHVTNNYP